MQIDIDRWQRLRAAAADAELDGPTVMQVQAANGRWARARDQLARFEAAGPQGRASGPPAGRARDGELILAGIGGHQPADVERAFERSVAELTARAQEAERESRRLTERLQQCAERRRALNQLIQATRAWAAAQSVVLPGDDQRESSPPLVTVPSAPPGAHDFLAGRVA